MQSIHQKKNLQLQVVVPKAQSRLLYASPVTHENITKSYDLDSMFGVIPFDLFAESFQDTIKIQLSNTEVNSKYFSKIKMDCFSHIGGRMCNVRNLPHARIGTASTCVGLLDIYIVLGHDEDFNYMNSAIELVYSAITKISHTAKNKMRSGQFLNEYSKDLKVPNDLKFEGNLLVSDFQYLFSELYVLLEIYDAKVYIETYGNKNFTCTTADRNGIKSIKDKLKSTFKKSEILNLLYIDICISVSTGDDQVSFATRSFYDSLGIEPNYSPLFSESSLNLNINTFNSKTGTLNNIGTKFNVYKCNFYSTYKYLFSKDKSTSCSVPVSLSLLLNKAFNTRTSGSNNKFDDMCNSISDIMTRFDSRSQKSYPFRVELRCNYRYLEQVITTFEQYIVLPDSFKTIDSRLFFKHIKYNLDLFLAEMGFKSNTPSEIYDFNRIIISAIAELVMKNCYLAGSHNCPLLPKITDDSLTSLIISSDYFQYLDTYLPKLLNSLYTGMHDNNDNKIWFLNQIITYNSVLKSYQKTFFRQAVRLYYDSNLTVDSACLNLIESYILQSTFSSSDMDMAILIRERNESDTYKMQAFKAFYKIFVEAKKSGRQSLSHLLFKICKIKLDKTEDQMLNLIFEFAKSVGISHIFRKKKPKNVNNTMFIQLVYESDTSETSRFERNSCLETFNSYQLTGSVKRKISDNEFIRFVHALFKYSNSSKRLLDIFNDFAYGFNPSRNITWVKNSLKSLSRLYKSKDQFLSIIAAVKEWNPNNFSIEDRLHEISSMGIAMTDTQYEAWLRLIQYDIDSWNESSILNDIRDSNPLSIYKALAMPLGKRENIKGYASHRSAIDMITRWNDEFLESLNNNIIEDYTTIASDNLVYNENRMFGTENHTTSAQSLCDLNLNENLNNLPEVTHELNEYSPIIAQAILNTNSEKTEIMNTLYENISTVPEYSGDFNNFDNSIEFDIADNYNYEDLEDSSSAIIGTKDDILEATLACPSVISQTLILENSIQPYNEYKINENLNTHMTESSKNNQLLYDSEDEIYLSRIFERFSYEPFSVLKSRQLIFKTDERPSSEVWQNFIKAQIKRKNMIQICNKPKKCQLNIRKKTGKAISVQEMISLIQNRFKTEWFSSNQLQHLFNTKNRFNSIYLNEFFEFAIRKKILRIEMKSGKGAFYNLEKIKDFK